MAHNIWKSISILVLLTSSTWAGCPPLTDQQVREYQRKLDNVYSAKVLFEVKKKLYHTRRVEWSNNTKELLLTIINQYDEIIKMYQSRGSYIIWEGTPPEPRDFNEFSAQLLEMAYAQNDIRFIHFLSNELGSGPLSVNAMAAIGEPALETVIMKLDKKNDGWSSQIDAVKVLEKWLKEPHSFLQNGSKRQLVKQHLLQLVNRKGDRSKRVAIDALRYINEPDVITHLTAISRNELLANNVRASARASLEFLSHR